MIIPNIWENKIDVPNHQPVYLKLIDFVRLSNLSTQGKFQVRPKALGHVLLNGLNQLLVPTSYWGLSGDDNQPMMVSCDDKAMI